MSLPLRITLLLAAVVVVFVAVHSAFLYLHIESRFREQGEERMLLCTTLLESRIQFLQEGLQKEMGRISASLFQEDESVLAAMLSPQREYTAEVVRFAETLRRRTTLDAFTVIGADGTILSSSENPASYGRADAFPDLPLDTPVYVWEEMQARMVLRRKTQFGNRILLLQGSYSVRPHLDRLLFPGLQVMIHERGGGPPRETVAPSDFRRTIRIRDYREAPLMLLTISYAPDEILQERNRIIQNSIIFIVLSLCACLILGAVLSRWISRPLETLTEAALMMSVGQLDVRVPQDAGGEVGELLMAFNRMAEQLEEQRQRLIHTERIAAWQEIARHLAHEIKNPLTPIRTSITNLRLAMEKAPDRFPEIFLESSESVLEEVEKLRRLADEFSRFARLPSPELRSGDLNELIRKCLVLYEGTPEVQVEFQPGRVPLLPFDPDQITEVVHNLVRNALQAITGGGTIRIATSAEGDPPQAVLLTVEDTGSGMTEEVRGQIFVPYFTTRDEGTGLGLPIVQRILSGHNATIRVESEPGRGSRFDIRFPV